MKQRKIGKHGPFPDSCHDLFLSPCTYIFPPGVARGCGWQKIGACVNLGAYYLVGVPVGYCFAFVYHMGGMVIHYSYVLYKKEF
jgi:Na+-driven multidrug efflux pump